MSSQDSDSDDNFLCLVLRDGPSSKYLRPVAGAESQSGNPGRLPIPASVPKITLLKQTETIIGRAVSSTINIPSTSISRCHAKITRFPDGSYQISDQSSGNGVYVNGTKLISKQNYPLTVGDEINLCPPLSLSVSLSVTMTVESNDLRHRLPSAKRERSLTALEDSEYAKRLRKFEVDMQPTNPAERSELNVGMESLEPAAKSVDYDEEKPTTSSAVEKTASSSDKICRNISDDLCCSICSELFIKATILNCGHTFCKACIEEWQRKQPHCPMCRVTIKNMVFSTLVNSLVSHVVDALTAEEKQERESLIEEREQSPPAPTTPPPSQASRRDREQLFASLARRNAQYPARFVARQQQLAPPPPPPQYHSLVQPRMVPHSDAQMVQFVSQGGPATTSGHVMVATLLTRTPQGYRLVGAPTASSTATTDHTTTQSTLPTTVFVPGSSGASSRQQMLTGGASSSATAVAAPTTTMSTHYHQLRSAFDRHFAPQVEHRRSSRQAAIAADAMLRSHASAATAEAEAAASTAAATAAPPTAQQQSAMVDRLLLQRSGWRPRQRLADLATDPIDISSDSDDDNSSNFSHDSSQSDGFGYYPFDD